MIKYLKIISLFTGIYLFFSLNLQAEDSGTILYASLTKGYWQIWRMDSDGANKEQLTKDQTDKRYPLYLSGENKVIYQTANSELFVMDADLANPKRIFSESGVLSDAAYCPKTKQLAYIRFREEVIDNSDIWVSKLNGEDKKMITSQWGLQYNPDFSPDGKNIVYISGHGFGTHEIMLIDLENNKTIQLTDNQALDFLPVFSTDGKSIAYVSDISGNYEIWLMDTKGKQKKQITNNKAIDTRPFFSKAGKEIIFTSARSGSLQIWKMNIGLNEAVQLTFENESQDPFLIK